MAQKTNKTKTKKPAKKRRSPTREEILARDGTLKIKAPTAKLARSVGRPSKYKPEYCDIVVELGSEGKSLEVIACHLGVIYQTMLDWAAANPEFSIALTLAKQLEQAWWEEAGQNNLCTPGYSAAMWSRSMAARFPKKWRENKQIDHGVTDGLAELMKELDSQARIPNAPTYQGQAQLLSPEAPETAE